jgi:hypothetical protein
MDVIRLVKKHSSLLLPIGITLAAILLFVPTQIAGRAVKSQMEESLNTASQIESLVRSTVPATQYLVERAYQQKHADDANGVTRLAEQASQRELLVYGIFPEPNETSSAVFINFGKAYRKAIAGLAADMRARDCPSEAEIADVIKQDAGGAVGGYGASGNNDAIIEQFCKDRAESIPVYASPEAFSGYDFWDNYNYTGRDTAIEHCWKSQVAYWIQKDVVDTIAAMDANSSSVSKSPVKRLVGISFSSEYRTDTTGQRAAMMAADMPTYVVSKKEGLLTIPWTDRISDSEIEVVHFAFSVIVSNKAVLQFMKELSSQKTHIFNGWSGGEPPQKFIHNQITILKSSIEPVIRTAGAGLNRYRYGDDAVVQLNLVCEYIFNKAGYAAIRPKLASDKTTKAKVDGVFNPMIPTDSPPTTTRDSGGSKKRSRLGEEGEM